MSMWTGWGWDARGWGSGGQEVRLVEEVRMGLAGGENVVVKGRVREREMDGSGVDVRVWGWKCG